MISKTQLPDGWEVVRLGEVAEVVGGSTPSRSRKEFWEGDVPWVVPSELTNLKGRYLTATKEAITDAGLQSAGLTLIPSGSVLLTTRATIGVTAINAIPVATNQGFQNLIVKNGIDPLWLFYGVSSIRRELERRAAGSTFLEVSRDSVRSLPLLLPPLPEQRAIAVVLDSIDEAIERTEEAIAATERLRDALLHELLTRGVPGWHSEWKEVPGIGTVPACWEVVRLGDVAEVRNGTTPSRAKSGYWQNGVIPFVRTGQVHDVTIEVPEELITNGAVTLGGAVVVPKGSVLIAMIGQGKTRGMSARLGIEAAINQNFAAVFGTERDFGLDFLFVWARQNYSDIRALGQGSNQDALNCELIEGMRVPKPTVAEQRAISAMADCFEDALEQERAERTSLHSLKSSASDALLTGHVRVSV